MSADPPAVLRLRAVLAELTSFVVSKGSGKQKRMAFVMRRVANDVCEEMGDSDPETVAAYFNQMGQVVSWIGTGDNDSLPQALRELFLPRAEGIQLAIESGNAGEINVAVQEHENVEDVVAAPGGVNP